MSEESNFYGNLFKNASTIEKIAAILIIFSFLAGTFGLSGDYAIVGVIMSGIGSLIALIKRNWALLVIGIIDFVILLQYMNDIAEINSILSGF